MFHALGSFVHRRRWATLGVTGALLVASILALLFGGRLGGSTVRGLESDRADALVDAIVGRSADTTFVVLFRSRDLAPASPDFQSEMARALSPLRSDPRVAQVEAPSDAGPLVAPSRVNEAERAALVLVTLRGDEKEALAAYPSVRAELASGSLEILATGKVPFTSDLAVQLEKDLHFAEILSFPLALIVLLLVFRTGVAAILPIGVGGLAVGGGIAVVLVLSHVADISQYTINVCSLIGLGVAIDYSLFTVSRYREELAAGHDYPEALAKAVDHAGRVVAFSALAVSAGLGGLLFFEGSYLRTMGIGGMIVVALAALFALTFLPALLAVLGPRIHALRLPLPQLRVPGGFWHRVSGWVMRRPVQVLVPTLAVLLLLASPSLKIRLAASDVRVLPAELEALSQSSGQLPEGVRPQLGPDATGVGWVFQYALIDRTGKHDLQELRTLQDWFLRFELATVKGVAEVASVGGFVKEYQVFVRPHSLHAYGIPLSRVADAIRSANQETGGRTMEMEIEMEMG